MSDAVEHLRVHKRAKISLEVELGKLVKSLEDVRGQATEDMTSIKQQLKHVEEKITEWQRVQIEHFQHVMIIEHRLKRFEEADDQQVPKFERGLESVRESLLDIRTQYDEMHVTLGGLQDLVPEKTENQALKEDLKQMIEDLKEEIQLREDGSKRAYQEEIGDIRKEIRNLRKEIKRSNKASDQQVQRLRETNEKLKKEIKALHESKTTTHLPNLLFEITPTTPHIIFF